MSDRTEDFLPGTFGCHEALHMASYFADAVQENLRDHPAIDANPEWRELADQAVSILAKLYQAIGAAHCGIAAKSDASQDGCDLCRPGPDVNPHDTPAWRANERLNAIVDRQCEQLADASQVTDQMIERGARAIIWTHYGRDPDKMLNMDRSIYEISQRDARACLTAALSVGEGK